MEKFKEIIQSIIPKVLRKLLKNKKEELIDLLSQSELHKFPNLTAEENEEMDKFESKEKSGNSLSIEETERLELLKLKIRWYTPKDDKYKEKQRSLTKDFLEREKKLLDNGITDEERSEYQKLARIRKEWNELSNEQEERYKYLYFRTFWYNEATSHKRSVIDHLAEEKNTNIKVAEEV